jgi:lysozyme
VKTSIDGVNLIKSFEGFRADAYPDPGTGAEPWTIGYGSTLTATGERVHRGMKVTEEEAVALLAATLGKYEAAVSKAVTQPLKQHQFDACVSLCYNIGAGNFSGSTLVKHLNAGHFNQAADAFLSWKRAAGRVMPGLIRRRQAERLMFLGGSDDRSALR